MASPRLTCGGVTAFGLPSTSAKWRFMFGNFLTACTNAYPIRCVKEILPPRVRFRWLLMTIRLSIIALAGMARTLVAVGTSRDADMFFTTAAAAPRSTWVSSAWAAGAGLLFAAGSAVLASAFAGAFSGAGIFAAGSSAFTAGVLASASLVSAPPLLLAGFGGGAGAGSGAVVGLAAGLPLPRGATSLVDS